MHPLTPRRNWNDTINRQQHFGSTKIRSAEITICGVAVYKMSFNKYFCTISMSLEDQAFFFPDVLGNCSLNFYASTIFHFDYSCFYGMQLFCFESNVFYCLTSCF